MASPEFSSSVLKSKFRGCMIGVLVGDCLGKPFEFKEFEFRGSERIFLPSSKKKLGDFMTDAISEESTGTFHHTDDTCMTINIASSLVDKEEVNAKDIAEIFTYIIYFVIRFVHDFFNQKVNRGYGNNVIIVFYKLRESEFKDVFLPAKEQFKGSGSFGNGAAMRTAPIALFGNNKGEDYIMNAAKECSLITHYHPNGYRGAILQCLAVNAALRLDPSQKFDPVKFIDGLLEKMEQIETEEMKPYSESLNKMKRFFLQNRKNVTSEEIAECLGNGSDVSALKSVPVAIYSFLRGMQPLSNYNVPRFVPTAVYSFLMGTEKHYIETSNPFIRTLYFAISVGGDADTITSMAGAIAGAYYGEEVIPDVVQKKCEAIDEVIALADKLFDVTYKNN